MPFFVNRNFENQLYDWFSSMQAWITSRPINLGGYTGPSGGGGSPPGGFVGQLPQKQVTYDTSEEGTLYTPPSGRSLLDNLNHIRYRIGVLEGSSPSSNGITIEENDIIIGSGITVLNFEGGVDVQLTGSGIVTVNITASGTDGISGSVIKHDDTFVASGITVLNFEGTVDVQSLGSGIVNITVTQEQNWIYGIFVANNFDETDESYHLYYSLDNTKTWTELSTTFGDTTRDPSILFYNNKFWVAHTHNGSPTDLIPIRSSSDLKTWTSVVEIDMSTLGLTYTYAWAPQWFIDVDKSVHLIFCGCDGGFGSTLYETHPTNATWTTWSSIVEITGTFTSPIDAILVYSEITSTYYLFWKNNQSSYICLSTSSSPFSGYTPVESGDWIGWGQREGITVCKIDDVFWRAYANTTLTNGIVMAESDDLFDTWSSSSAVSEWTARSHGDVVQIQDFNAYKILLKAIGIFDVQLEGSGISSNVSTLNFTGSVDADYIGSGIVTISIAGGTPGNSVVTEQQFSQSPASGTSIAYSRVDHTHGTPYQPTRQIIFTMPYTLAETVGGLRMYNQLGINYHINEVFIAVATPPVSSGSVIVDINKNGTTIFTTQSNRPTITSGNYTGNTTTIEVEDFNDGDYLTMDIDVPGSGTSFLTTHVVLVDTNI